MTTQTDPWGIAIEWHDNDPDDQRLTLVTFADRETLDDKYHWVVKHVAGKADLVIVKRTAGGGWERVAA